jgi:hypothetical protein
MSWISIKILVAVAALAFFFLVPFSFERIPEFQLTLVNENGDLLSGVEVIQEMTDYTFNNRQIVKVKSDAKGQITFPAHVIKGSIAYRVTRPVFSGLMLLAHGSTGATADMYVGEDTIYTSSTVARWSSDSSIASEMPEKLIAGKN